MSPPPLQRDPNLAAIPHPQNLAPYAPRGLGFPYLTAIPFRLSSKFCTPRPSTRVRRVRIDAEGLASSVRSVQRPHRAQPPMAVGPAGSGPRAGRGSRAGARRGNDREPLGCCVQACASGFRISRRGLSPKDRTARENLAARIRAQARGTDPVRRRIGVRAAGSDIESAEPPEERDALIRWPAAQSADPQLTSYRPRRLSSFPPPRPCILYVMARAGCLGVPLGHCPLCVAGTAERSLAPLPRLASPAFLRPVSLRENTDYSALP